MISERNGQKKHLRGHFGELSEESLNRIWSVHRYCIISVYVLSKDSFFKGWCEKIVKRGDAWGGKTNKW